MGTTIGRWTKVRTDAVSQHIVAFLLTRNKWFRFWDNETLKQFTPIEQAHIQYYEAMTYVNTIKPFAEENQWNTEDFMDLLSKFEGGLDATGISDRLIALRKPNLVLHKKQITFFIRRHISESIIEESINGFNLFEFTVNGYKKEVSELPIEWRNRHSEDS